MHAAHADLTREGAAHRYQTAEEAARYPNGKQPGHSYTRGKCCGVETAPAVKQTFVPCDLTLGLDAPGNAQLAAEVQRGFDLVLCSFVLVETAEGARAGGWACLADCARILRGRDCYLLAVDTSHRLWPEIIGVLRGACPEVRAWLPRNTYRKIALLASLGGGHVTSAGGAGGPGGAEQVSRERVARCEAAAAGRGEGR